MDTLAVATLAALLILVASMLSVELALSAAIIEIVLGVLAGNLLGLTTAPWLDFLASFASVLLTFLAGAEVDPAVLRNKWAQALADRRTQRRTVSQTSRASNLLSPRKYW